MTLIELSTMSLRVKIHIQENIMAAQLFLVITTTQNLQSLTENLLLFLVIGMTVSELSLSIQHMI